MSKRFYFAPIALAGVMLGASVVAFAQTLTPSDGQVMTAPSATASALPGAHGHRHHRHGGLSAALEQLSLTADQKTKIDGLVRADRDAFRKSQTPQTSQTRMANRAKMRGDIESVLTPAQKSQFEAALAHHMKSTGAPTPQSSPA